MSPIDARGGAPARAQRRAAVVVYGLAALVTAAVLALAVSTVTASRDAPALTTEGGSLAEALRWPWPNFPGVAPVERLTIRRQFQLDEPLVAARLRPWTTTPTQPALRPRTADGRRALDAALAEVARLRPPEPGERTGFDATGVDDAAAAALDAALEALDRVPGGDGAWVVRYDRGVVSLWRGAPAVAQRELTAAARLLDPRSARGPRDRAEQWSAYAHTQYALGHALLRNGGAGAGGTDASARKDDAVRAFRLAVIGAVQVAEARDLETYPGVSSALRFFPLRPTGLSTGALTNDLVAAYLAHGDYHDCPQRPDAWPCDAAPGASGTCSYRDKIFCSSVRRTGPPFGAPFVGLMRDFYAGEGGAWGEESRLWALSNAVDRTAANLDVGDPYLLYNFGSLLVEQGRFDDAAGYLQRALDQVTDDMPDADLERLQRLATVGQVLAGRSPRGGGAARERPSSLRRLYRQLYEDRDDLPVREFPPVGGAFEPDAESLLDRWLFLQLWRAQLAAGDLAGFEREFARLEGRDGVPGDFFATWRREVMTDLGQRALARADDYAEAGENDQARRVRFFLSESGHFPHAIERRARTARGWLTWSGRLLAQPAALAVAVVLLVLLWGAARGLVRSHRSLFLSAHRRDRLQVESAGFAPAAMPASPAPEGEAPPT